MSKASTVITAPGRYVQGRGAIYELGKHIEILGYKKALVVGGKTGLASTREGREVSFKEKGIEQIEEVFNGEVTYPEIDRLRDLALSNKCDVIIASGGGKALDAVKGAAYKAKIGTVIVPTVASSDAPCSALSVVYIENELPENLFLPNNPNLVLVDVDLIAKAPVRSLVAGMGDAFATYYEARACKRSDAITPSKGLCTNTAYSMAKLSNQILLEQGLQAKIAVENQVVNKALENIIETNTYLSGVGFENNGCAVSHGFYNGVSRLQLEFSFMHGECVAFGTLVQLVLENVPFEEFTNVQKFYKSIGLPLTLKDIGLDTLSDEQMREAVRGAMDNNITHNMPFEVTFENLLDAVINADRLGAIASK